MPTVIYGQRWPNVSQLGLLTIMIHHPCLEWDVIISIRVLLSTFPEQRGRAFAESCANVAKAQKMALLETI
ncbi:hypothetical protein HOE425_333336 [Hoeflea sp. EC-HK425]|nr:hypothetical protein HOE425_333336 [Hoeflea sp. EC-HK425]